MTSSRREDERVHKNAIFNRLSTGVGSAFKASRAPVGEEDLGVSWCDRKAET